MSSSAPSTPASTPATKPHRRLATLRTVVWAACFGVACASVPPKVAAESPPAVPHPLAVPDGRNPTSPLASSAIAPPKERPSQADSVDGGAPGLDHTAPISGGESNPPDLLAPSEAVSILHDGQTRRCRPQRAQPFLVRGNWFGSTPGAPGAGRQLLAQAIRYRTEHYGYFAGFGNPTWNPHPPSFYAKAIKFLGFTVQLHAKLEIPLRCVEAALTATHARDDYRPRSVSGIRFRNTYRGSEVSNHVYGIALDIDPDRNTCCGCVAPWPNHPLCKAKKKSIWERMAMPKSWVETFEAYGFYWLGHDVLQDTMHFEFLGDPDAALELAP